jgi:methyl-accepting chemotaxis protein
MAQEKPGKKLYLVNRDFQFRYTRISVAIGVVSTFLTCTVILYPLYLFKILVVPQFLPAPILASMVAAALINISLLVVFGILLSHKIAGPMFSMVRHVRKIASGDWNTQMRSRAGDDLQFVVRNLNDLSTALVDATKSDIEILDKALAQPLDEKSKTLLTELKSRLLKRIQSTAPTFNKAEASHD